MPIIIIIVEVCVYSLCRVVLAARSEWFRRALQSGMIEDRDKRCVGD